MGCIAKDASSGELAALPLLFIKARSVFASMSPSFHISHKKQPDSGPVLRTRGGVPSCQQAVARVTYKQMMGLRLVADVLVVHVGGCRCCNSCLLPTTLHCTSHLPHFHLLWKRRLLSAHDATHSHYGGSAIDLQFCCPFDKGKKRKLPLALFYLCSSHCAIFMSSLKVSKVSFLKHFVP